MFNPTGNEVLSVILYGSVLVIAWMSVLCVFELSNIRKDLAKIRSQLHDLRRQ
jgi:hypothetical protein